MVAVFWYVVMVIFEIFFFLNGYPTCCVDLILGRQVLSFSGSMLSGICWSHYQLLGVFVKKLGLGVELEFAHAMVAAVWVLSNDRPDNFLLNVYSILWIARVEFPLVRSCL